MLKIRSTLPKRLFPVLLLTAGLLVGLAGGLAAARQPHMENALAALQTAKAELERASRDKGGHRVKAIRLINEAILEVRKGIKYDDEHLSPKERQPYRP